MKVLHELSECRSEPGPLCLAIGFFDGMHRGHARVIAATRRRADERSGRTWVMTFDPHPAAVLKPDAAPRLMTTLAQKLRLIEREGVDGCVVIPFTKALSERSPESFVRMLTENTPQLSGLFVGRNWRFGKDRRGSAAVLRDLARPSGIDVTAVPYSKRHGEPVSSTRIRTAITVGDLDEAAAMLGRPVSVFGTVARGRQVGRELGFPTANIDTGDILLPPYGIYAAYASFGDDTPRPSIVSYGVRPTFLGAGSAPAVFEVHVFDFDGELYGAEAEIYLMGRIRDEIAFENADALRTAMVRDASETRKLLRRKKLKESLYTLIGA